MDTLPIITNWESALQKGQLCSHEHKTTSLNVLESLLGKAHFEEEIYTTIFCSFQQFLILITMVQKVKFRPNIYTKSHGALWLYHALPTTPYWSFSTIWIEALSLHYTVYIFFKKPVLQQEQTVLISFQIMLHDPKC